MNDPAFIAEAKRENLEIQEVSGTLVAKILDDSFAMPPDVIKAVADAMSITGSGGD